MIIDNVFSVLQAIAFNHQYVEITYTNSMGYTKKATGRVEIERNWCYLYDDGKSGQDYNVAFPIPNLSIRSIEPIYPIAFLTDAGGVFKKRPTELSSDGTPRYIPNPNSNATHCFQDCLKDHTPIWSKSELEEIKSNTWGNLERVKTILVSLAEKVESGKITIREAAIELHKAGWTNFIDIDTTKNLLGLN